MTPEQIAKIADPEKRAVEAHQFVQRGELALRRVRDERDAAVAALRVAGWSQRKIAALLGLSPAMVMKIDRSQGVVSERRAVQP